jgi:hypothetical protein
VPSRTGIGRGGCMTVGSTELSKERRCRLRRRWSGIFIGQPKVVL